MGAASKRKQPHLLASDRDTVVNDCRLSDFQPYFMSYLCFIVGHSTFFLNLRSSFTSRHFGLNFLFGFLTQEMVNPSPVPSLPSNLFPLACMDFSHSSSACSISQSGREVSVSAPVFNRRRLSMLASPFLCRLRFCSSRPTGLLNYRVR